MTSTVIVINVIYITAKQRMIQGNYNMTGIMKPYVMLYHFWFRTSRIFSFGCLLYSIRLAFLVRKGTGTNYVNELLPVTTT